MEINICFGISDEYSQHCACTMASILYNSKPQDKYHFYIITNYISKYNQKCLKSLRYIKNFKLSFLYVDAKQFSNLNVDNNLGESTFFRFKAFGMPKIDKLIYLDVDLIVRKDIGELYNTNVEDHYLAGAEDLVAPEQIKKYELSPTTTYINAGVLLLNLNYCRTHNALKQLIDFVNKPWEKQWNDQHIINYLFQNKIKPVDIKWNCTYYASMYENQEYFHEMAKDPSIVHYIGPNKPWLPNCNPHLKNDYFKYLAMTPYFENFIKLYQSETFRLLLNDNNEIHNKLNQINEKLNNLLNQ